MPINMSNIPKALLYFFIGAITMYLMWEMIPLIFNILSGLTDVDMTGVIPIFWFGIIIVSILIVIGIPIWILFEED